MTDTTGIATVTEAARRAGAAAEGFGALAPAARRDLLDACAAALEAAADGIVAAAADESGLAPDALRGEMARTTGQLRLLGAHVAAGRHAPERVSAGVAAGDADVRTVRVAVGPVAVFAASNFPLAFGVAGGDTAAALAAGCPVVAKAHPAQPETGRAVARALGGVLPEGVFSLVEGGADVSLALVRAAEIRAVGFTGSLTGGRALMDAAAARPEPIPVYAEMGSLNPVFVLPGAAGDEEWAAALAGSVTRAMGQLCTKPGLVVLPETPEGEKLAESLAQAVAAAPSHRMLTAPMARAHEAWGEAARALPDAAVTAGPGAPGPFAVRVPATRLTGELLDEHFGPAVVLATAPASSYAALARTLPGSLTATLLGTPADEPGAAPLLRALALRAGRVVWNGVPTGVAVCEAMVHGGPWPATSAPWSTSVGTAAVDRFTRPVALQGVPRGLLGGLAG
ncbi:aldehyde dehydrogenase family protein [Streptomyces sp. NPDC006684]|uniref:aldehyde dehydrogenase family protein n=1 Tax=Streptomyces sp. NPDC006684 TaxID=3154477 RepID=UPI00345474DD